MHNPVPALTPEEFAQRFSDLHPPFTAQAAAVEASRCLFCFDAPCTAACPTHIDVPRFIKKIATGNPRGSALAILDANILGLSCSRVCPVDVLCEGACVMHRYNRQPIEIGGLQRAAMDWFYAHSPSLPVAANQRKKRVACIGGGPASLACAAELRRCGYGVTIFDQQPMAGGLNTYGIAEYKLRPADSLKARILSVIGAVELLGHQSPVPTQDGFRLGNAGNLSERLRPRRFPISASVARSGSVRRKRAGSFALKTRFSAAKYSFRRRSSWFAEPVTYASGRSHLLFLILLVYLTGWQAG